MQQFERLKVIRNHYKLTQDEFARGLEIKQGSYSDIERGRIDNISTSILTKIAFYYNININWLLTGEGEMLKGEMKKNEKITTNKNSIPMISLNTIAGYHDLDHDDMLAQCEQYAIPDFSEKGAEFVIRVSGNSMCPKYCNGDIVACRIVKDIVFLQWGKPYVIDSSQGIMIKRVYEEKDNPNCIRCYSDNKEFYPEFVIPKSDIRSLSIVVGLIRVE